MKSVHNIYYDSTMAALYDDGELLFIMYIIII